DFLTPCNLADANLNKCLAANVQGIFVQWKDGLPGKNSIGSFDPLLLKRVKIEQDASSTIAINADMKDVHVTGASKLIIKDANYNADKYVIKAVAFVPKLRFEFDYKLKGHVLALNLDGQGKGSFEADKMLMLLEMGVKPRNTPEANFADVQYFKVGFKDIGNFHIQLHNLIAGNPELEKSAHTLINENWRQFYEVLKPAIEQTIEAVLLDRSTKILNYVPATYIIDNFH
ncbi:CG14258, partial [Drosophila busckii]